VKLFLLLLLISLAGYKTGFSQQARKQATQVITLRLMPVHVIELPPTAAPNKKEMPARWPAAPAKPGSWFIDKQLLTSTSRQEVPSTKSKSNSPAISTSNAALMDSPVLYTVTTL
jgi:hypothetical protein